MGNIVVDHEEVTRNFPEGKGTLELIMIYEVQRGRIVRAWSIAGAKSLGPICNEEKPGRIKSTLAAATVQASFDPVRLQNTG